MSGDEEKLCSGNWWWSGVGGSDVTILLPLKIYVPYCEDDYSPRHYLEPADLDKSIFPEIKLTTNCRYLSAALSYEICENCPTNYLLHDSAKCITRQVDWANSCSRSETR